MDRRSILKKLGESVAITGVGTMARSADTGTPDISEAEAEEMLKRAAEKDAKRWRQSNPQGMDATTSAIPMNENRKQRSSPQGGNAAAPIIPADRGSHVRKALNELEPKTRAAVLEDRLAVESYQTSERVPADPSGTTNEAFASGTSILYYDLGAIKSWVAKWHQRVDYGWNEENKITYIDERYWGETSTGGKIDQWKQKWSKKAAESGGKGESRYRLFTKVQYAMCFGFYPVQSCTNHTTLWVDMSVKPGIGNDDIETR